MNEDLLFNIDKVSLSNLSNTEEDVFKKIELRMCEIAFIADSIASASSEYISDGMTVSDILAVLGDELVSLFSPSLDLKTSSLFNLNRITADLSDVDKAVFSDLLLSKFNERGIHISESDFLEAKESDEVFTYVKNSYSDEAYDVFSQEFEDPRVMYSESFREACFAVADGRVGYCILPFEERGGMRIPGIYSMISKLDLKIASVTPVFGPEGTSDMKYALVGRGYFIPEIGEDVDRYLEIRVSTDESIESLLNVAKYFDLSVYRINTMYSDSDENGSSFYSLVLKDGGKSFVAFLIFMTVFMSNYTPVGIYKNLE